MRAKVRAVYPDVNVGLYVQFITKHVHCMGIQLEACSPNHASHMSLLFITVSGSVTFYNNVLREIVGCLHT